MPIRGPGKSKTVQTPVDSLINTAPLLFTVRKWYTDIETVKKMYSVLSRSLGVQNEEEILVGYFESELEFGKIIENSEKVKVLKRALSPDAITFTDESWEVLNNNDLARGSVLVTDTSEKIEWTEGVDFEIDYTSGKIRRVITRGKAGSATSTGAGVNSSVNNAPILFSIEQTVKVQYEYYSAKIKDYDYSINYEKGTISRKDGGTLVSGSKVYVDYKVSNLIRDEAIGLAIDQAHTWINSRIGTEYESSPDDNLRYAEAYFSLHLISKMSAANLVFEKRTDDVEEAAKELKLISDDYRIMALSFLKDSWKFPEAGRGGSKVRNRTWDINLNA
ncbi:MAG: hypothetical protein GY863_14750 [bacterium]|nr:hypothetical protein [bacterium]